MFKLTRTRKPAPAVSYVVTVAGVTVSTHDNLTDAGAAAIDASGWESADIRDSAGRWVATV